MLRLAAQDFLLDLKSRQTIRMRSFGTWLRYGDERTSVDSTGILGPGLAGLLEPQENE